MVQNTKNITLDQVVNDYLLDNNDQHNLSPLQHINEHQEIKNLWRIKAVGANSIIELRAINLNGVVIPRIFKGSDYNSVDELRSAFEQEALKLNAQGYNIYVVMNPINENFLGSSASDKDIAYRDLLLIDIDRHDTKNPATEEELDAANSLAIEVEKHLKKEGWNDPIKVMSGNGYHLYYILDHVANTEDSRDYIKGLLKNLATSFDNDVVRIDTSVFNASRIAKVVGTIAYKGEESAARPYRMARCV